MKHTFTTYGIGKTLKLEGLIELARSSGCAGIEFRTGSGQPHGVEIGAEADQRKRIRRVMEDAYLEVACVTTGYRFDSPVETTRRENIEGAKESARLAHDLGCGRVRVFGNDIPAEANAQDCVAYVGEALAEVAEYAAPLGVDILLEMHGQFNFWGYAVGAVKRANHPNVGINYNCDMRDLVGGSVLETYERVASCIRHVHAHELHSGFPYLQLFQLLLRDGYTGYLSAEVPDSAEAERYMSLYVECARALLRVAKLTSGQGGLRHG